MGRLDGKVALISGGARGQGAAEAKLCAREGAQVVFGDVLDEDGRHVEAEIRTAGGNATYVHSSRSLLDQSARAPVLALETQRRALSVFSVLFQKNNSCWWRKHWA